jgi:hypothetical protein
MLLGEFRRRCIVVPGITQIERMVGKALLDAEISQKGCTSG